MSGNGVRAATAAKWSERIREWRGSGLTAAQFAEGKGFEASTLRFWAYRLKEPVAAAPRVVELVPKSRSSASCVSGSPEILIEVGAARVRVCRGFDRELLAQVVDALGGVR